MKIWLGIEFGRFKRDFGNRAMGGRECADSVLQIDELLRRGLMHLASDFKSDGGGMCAGAAVADCRVGGHATPGARLGDDEDERIRFANAAATIKCGRTGGRACYPNRAEVERLLKGETRHLVSQSSGWTRHVNSSLSHCRFSCVIPLNGPFASD
ncbi:MAG: hypothetical protein OXB95_09815 [Rhodobacteraceae bacterium]|nr:hypothetical protein [Paracoccaceae bacterium]